MVNRPHPSTQLSVGVAAPPYDVSYEAGQSQDAQGLQGHYLVRHPNVTGLQQHQPPQPPVRGHHLPSSYFGLANPTGVQTFSGLTDMETRMMGDAPTLAQSLGHPHVSSSAVINILMLDEPPYLPPPKPRRNKLKEATLKVTDDSLPTGKDQPPTQSKTKKPRKSKKTTQDPLPAGGNQQPPKTKKPRAKKSAPKPTPQTSTIAIDPMPKESVPHEFTVPVAPLGHSRFVMNFRDPDHIRDHKDIKDEHNAGRRYAERKDKGQKRKREQHEEHLTDSDCVSVKRARLPNAWEDVTTEESQSHAHPSSESVAPIVGPSRYVVDEHAPAPRAPTLQMVSATMHHVVPERVDGEEDNPPVSPTIPSYENAIREGFLFSYPPQRVQRAYDPDFSLEEDLPSTAANPSGSSGPTSSTVSSITPMDNSFTPLDLGVVNSKIAILCD
ncbi:hypothetical protein D9758_000862 [Tetrapyrgos nigripes]|uniref:Uncharacterized protein n=1 Tax=Tetrapyrgos nigripes TaxID=182062 RepID=A0A8H5GZ46_9AGAR|nr:hypothetical protein D9758_000862 [Tetrapyrgos nigripes]